MMFQLVWTDAARAELRAIWYGAPASDSQLLIWAIADVAFRLQRDPLNEGESRPLNTRIMCSWPLAALFNVRGNTVYVQHVWRYGR
jgi:hypothetical protein